MDDETEEKFIQTLRAAFAYQYMPTPERKADCHSHKSFLKGLKNLNQHDKYLREIILKAIVEDKISIFRETAIATFLEDRILLKH